VIVFGGSPGNNFTNTLKAAWTEVWAKYPGIKVLEGPIDTNWDPAQYQQIMAGLLAKYPQIDAVYTSLFRELLASMMEDARNITPCTHLLFCAKNLERIGDHATNVAETIYYAATAEQLPERSRQDKSHSVTLDVAAR